MARGQPNRPAPVSGPGALSRRTDGGPGSATQPLRTPSGGAYGERQALVNQQKAAPLAARNGQSSSSGPGRPAPRGAPPLPTGGVFGPTARPGEPGTAGVMGMGPPQGTPDVEQILRTLYTMFPHPKLLSLMRRD